jgi:hypothetical protein
MRETFANYARERDCLREKDDLLNEYMCSWHKQLAMVFVASQQDARWHRGGLFEGVWSTALGITRAVERWR